MQRSGILDTYRFWHDLSVLSFETDKNVLVTHLRGNLTRAHYESKFKYHDIDALVNFHRCTAFLSVHQHAFEIVLQVRHPLGTAPHLRHPLATAPHLRHPLGTVPHLRHPVGTAPHLRHPLGTALHLRHVRQPLDTVPQVIDK